MAHFITDETALPFPKVDRKQRNDISVDEQVRASDFNKVCQALIDTRGYLADEIVPNLGGAGAVPSTRDIDTTFGIEGGGDLSANRTLRLRSSDVGFVSVKDPVHGAVGDGVVNDTAAVSAAIVSGASLGCAVVLPKGTYLLNSEITITATSGVRVRGEAGQTYIRYSSTARNGFTIASTSRNVTIEDIAFTGDASDDYSVNLWPAIQINTDSIGINVLRCRFEQCLPLQANDSFSSGRLIFAHNYVHNAPNGMHPPSDSQIVNNYFICDSVVTTRAQAIYAFGQQTNILIQGNTFRNINSQDIQIRSSDARYDSRSNFRILGNHFENSKQASIWIGSDDHPQITAFVVANNTFRNCNSPVTCYAGSAEVVGNHIEYDWEYSYALPSAADAIIVTTGLGAVGHYQIARAPHVHGNTIVVRHPFVGIITLVNQPNAGDTITVGEFTYTWVAAGAVDGQINIGANRRESTNLLAAALRGLDLIQAAPNNVLRSGTDILTNYYATSYGQTDDNVVVVSGWYDFSAQFATNVGNPRMTVSAVRDMRTSVGYPVNITGTLSPVVESNTFVDLSKGPTLVQNYEPVFRNNTFLDGTGIAAVYEAHANVFSHYHGNRIIQQNKALQDRQYFAQISDGFPVIEDEFVIPQQFTNDELQGRSGLSLVGDGKAYTLLFYGAELGNTPSSRLFRWDEGDQVLLWNGAAMTTYTFKRTAPGAGQFNSADSLLALINASAQWTASYAAFTNNLGGVDPKLTIKIVHAAGGTAGNDDRIYIRRYAKSGAAYTTTVQRALTCGQILRDSFGTKSAFIPEEFCWFYGGAATLTKTFVYTPLANAKRGVWVQGHDAASQALAPAVYAADIVPGVGFWITHAAAAGTEKFFWRVG